MVFIKEIEKLSGQLEELRDLLEIATIINTEFFMYLEARDLFKDFEKFKQESIKCH